MANRVLITASTFDHIYRFHLPYIREFKSLGWEVHLACGGAVIDIPDADKVYELPLEKSILSPRNLRASHIVRRIVTEQTYDLIITHTSLAAFFTRLALKGLRNRPRTINVVHGYLFDRNFNSSMKAALLRTAEYILKPQTDKVLTMNESDYDWAKHHKVAGEVRNIPGMGVDESRFVPQEATGDRKDDFVLAYLAEFSERKNQKALIGAMTLLPSNIKLILAGDGKFRESCMAQAKELGMQDRIEFPGYIENVVSLLSRADAAVSSSYSEGLPFNILEAMLTGLPVVASRVKGNMDLVKEGVNGYLFNENSPEEFAGAVIKLASDRDKAMEMGRAGRKIAQAYTLKQVKADIMKEYLE